MTKVYAIKRDKIINQHQYQELYKQLSGEKQIKISGFIKSADRERAILGECLLREILSRALNKSKISLEFKTDENGKPYLLNHRHIHFNLSHSGDWIVSAFSGEKVGIDVELINPVDFQIVERFFSDREINLFLKTQDDKKLDMFYTLWTLKESFIKADGKGLSLPLNSFSIDLASNTVIFDKKITEKRYYLKQYELDPEYKLSVCSMENDFNGKIDHVSITDLLKA